MRRFRLFWIQTSVSLLLGGFAAAADGFVDAEPEKIKGNESASILEDSGILNREPLVRTAIYTVDSKDITQLFAQIKDNPSAPDVEKGIFNLFCESGRVVRLPKRKVSLLVPAPPAGVPLDVALSDRTKYVSSVTEFLKSRFFIKFSPANYIDSKEIERIRNGLKEHTFHESLKLAGFEFNDFKRTRAASKASPSKFKPIAVTFPDDETIYIGRFEVNEIQYNFEKTVLGKFDPSLEIAEKDDIENIFRSTRHFAKWSKDKDPDLFLVAKRGWRVKSSVDDKKKSVTYPLDFGFFGDLATLKSSFTMIVPRAKQEELFHRSFGYGDGGELVPSRLIEESKSLWQEYVKTFTTLKEAPSSDPSVLNFEVSLDLGLFCKTAKPLSAFSSK